MEEGKRSSGGKLDAYVRTLADFAQRRLGTDLGLSDSDEVIDPQLELNGSDEGVEIETERRSNLHGGGGGWGPPQPGLVQEQVEAAIEMLAVIHGAGLAFGRSNREKSFGQSDPFNTYQTREAISVHMTPHLTHLTRLSAAEGLGHNLMAGLRAGIREVPRLIQATRKHSDSFRTVCHGSPTLDSFQFKIREAESNKDNKDSKDSKDFKDFNKISDDSNDSEKAAAIVTCRLKSSDQTWPTNQVSPLTDVAHLLLTSCPSYLTPLTWQAAISTYYTKLAWTVAQFGLLLKHLGISEQALQAEAGRVLAGQWLVVALVIPAVENCSRIDRGFARALLCAAKRMDLQVYWPARRLSAPNLGLVRMNSVSEEQEEEDEENEEEKKELVVKVKMRKPVFEVDGKVALVKEKENCTLSNVPVVEAGKDVETQTIQAGRGIEKKTTKNEFSGPLPALAVG